MRGRMRKRRPFDLRYGARHPFSLERLSETVDGRIAYKFREQSARKPVA